MKFKTRHDLRDQRLPQIRNEMLNHIVSKLYSRQGVEGIFIGGSIAKNNEDLFSDIDLRIVVSEDQFDDYIRNKQDLALDFGEVLFFEDMNMKSPFTIAHYSNFIKMDLFIYTYAQLKPSLWLKEIKILLDPYGQLQEILNQSNEMAYIVSKEEVEIWRGKVFAYIHEVYRRVFREEYYYALVCLNHLRSFIVSAWNMEVNRHSNDHWDWSKIEGARSSLEEWQLSLLSSWMSGRDQEEIMKTLNSMVPEIRRLHDTLCDKTGVDRNSRRLDQVLNLVM